MLIGDGEKVMLFLNIKVNRIAKTYNNDYKDKTNSPAAINQQEFNASQDRKVVSLKSNPSK